ncbi:hypothetical protein [Thalassobaculum fulvum]|nr:hypothetical protein [Thalassobaculum fulvum]
MAQSAWTMWGRVLPLLAALLLAAPAAHAAASRPAASTQTIGGYVYSWFEWAIALPKSMILGVDADVVAARAALVGDIERLKAMVALAGFRVETVSVAMGLIPAVSLSLAYDRAISEQELAALRAELRGGKFGFLEKALLEALLDASSATIGKEGDSLSLASVDVDVDVIPTITLNFEEAGPAGAKD